MPMTVCREQQTRNKSIVAERGAVEKHLTKTRHVLEENHQ